MSSSPEEPGDPEPLLLKDFPAQENLEKALLLNNLIQEPPLFHLERPPPLYFSLPPDFLPSKGS